MSRFGTSRRLPLDKRGATPVEMAMVGSGFLLLMLGGAEVSRYYFVSESLHYLVGEVARAVIVNPDTDLGALKTNAVRRAPILQSEKLTLNVGVDRNVAPAPTTVTVTASYNHFVQHGRARNEWSNLFRPLNAAITLTFVAP